MDLILNPVIFWHVILVDIGDIDKVCFINAKDISSKNKIALRETASKMTTNGSRVVEDFLEPKMQA